MATNDRKITKQQSSKALISDAQEGSQGGSNAKRPQPDIKNQVTARLNWRRFATAQSIAEGLQLSVLELWDKLFLHSVNRGLGAGSDFNSISMCLQLFCKAVTNADDRKQLDLLLHNVDQPITARNLLMAIAKHAYGNDKKQKSRICSLLLKALDNGIPLSALENFLKQQDFRLEVDVGSVKNRTFPAERGPGASSAIRGVVDLRDRSIDPDASERADFPWEKTSDSTIIDYLIRKIRALPGRKLPFTTKLVFRVGEDGAIHFREIPPPKKIPKWLRKKLDRIMAKQ